MKKITHLLKKINHAIRLAVNAERFFYSQRKRYGNTFSVHIPGLNKVVFTSDPRLTHKILQTEHHILSSSLPNPIEVLVGKGSLILLQGAAHEQERNQLKPVFQGQCLRQYSRYMQEAIAETTVSLVDTVDAQQFMKNVTLDIILRAVFGISSSQRRTLFADAIFNLLNAFGPLLLLFPQARFSLLGISPWDRFIKARSVLDELIYSEIESRKDKKNGDDILSYLMQQPKDSINSALAPEHIRDELTTLLLAGHETTANTL
ncbi:MAG TPA: cytochrome P450, partial [Methanosarcina sp.]|nr:cytochrome P450 [Methanosarcina sp.]